MLKGKELTEYHRTMSELILMEVSKSLNILNLVIEQKFIKDGVNGNHPVLVYSSPDEDIDTLDTEFIYSYILSEDGTFIAIHLELGVNCRGFERFVVSKTVPKTSVHEFMTHLSKRVGLILSEANKAFKLSKPSDYNHLVSTLKRVGVNASDLSETYSRLVRATEFIPRIGFGFCGDLSLVGATVSHNSTAYKESYFTASFSLRSTEVVLESYNFEYIEKLNSKVIAYSSQVSAVLDRVKKFIIS